MVGERLGARTGINLSDGPTGTRDRRVEHRVPHPRNKDVSAKPLSGKTEKLGLKLIEVCAWAQINGRNAISWQQKFEFDIWYVDNQSFWLDIKIILLTVKKVFARSDINATGEVTMTKFTGDNS